MSDEIELPKSVQKRLVKEVPKNYVGLTIEMTNFNQLSKNKIFDQETIDRLKILNE